MIAPLNFILRAPQSTAMCNMFKWDGGVSPFPPPSNNPSCECRADWVIDGRNRCGLTFVMANLIAPVMTDSNPLRFSIDSTNPDEVEKEIGNYWTITHYRKTGVDVSTGVPRPVFKIMATHAATSWSIDPQLQYVTVAIEGLRSAAESITDIRISFKAVRSASVLEVRALQPADFKFDMATVDANYEIDGATGNEKLFLNGVGIEAGMTKVIVVRNVKLGVQGGGTVWWFQTYDRKLIGGVPRHESDKRDQAYNVFGFLMPGILLVQAKLEILVLPSPPAKSDGASDGVSQFPASPFPAERGTRVD